ncbi:hypothetical protein AOQ84DRAFT_406253 [Glonium stellatum]|uniref:Uncharacterized protein n=1 Tax=Glonium stellatum TaxID=574774 RepID=A0A8E2F2E1_9PEZI|nr:hypothetical protein AOQ84DRAFT_406253 [Glonium stellatum]
MNISTSIVAIITFWMTLTSAFVMHSTLAKTNSTLPSGYPITHSTFPAITKKGSAQGDALLRLYKDNNYKGASWYAGSMSQMGACIVTPQKEVSSVEFLLGGRPFWCLFYDQNMVYISLNRKATFAHGAGTIELVVLRATGASYSNIIRPESRSLFISGVKQHNVVNNTCDKP